MKEHSGACHCGAVKITVMAPEKVTITECNCSICNMTGYLHLIVPANQFKLVEGEDNLTTYTFNTGTAKHNFCKTCGIKAFYIPRSHPDGFSVNFRCLDKSGFTDVETTQTNGKEWEKTYPEGRGSYS